MAIFEGAGVALVTPFTESGEVNYEKLEALLEGADCRRHRRDHRVRHHWRVRYHELRGASGCDPFHLQR